MLTQIDPIQLAGADSETAAKSWGALLRAEPDEIDELPALGARRQKLAIVNVSSAERPAEPRESR